MHSKHDRRQQPGLQEGGPSADGSMYSSAFPRAHQERTIESRLLEVPEMVSVTGWRISASELKSGRRAAELTTGAAGSSAIVRWRAALVRPAPRHCACAEADRTPAPFRLRHPSDAPAPLCRCSSGGSAQVLLPTGQRSSPAGSPRGPSGEYGPSRPPGSPRHSRSGFVPLAGTGLVQPSGRCPLLPSRVAVLCFR